MQRLFAYNGYPRVFFDRALKKFLSSQSQVGRENDMDSVDADRRYVFGVPFIGKASKEYKNKIADLIKEHLQVDIDTYYTSCKVSSFFSLKSKVPFSLKARVVYKFSCLSDSDTSYIGQTKRHLVTRAKEHITPKESNQSEIKNHIFGCDKCKNGNLNVNNFRVLKQCKDEYATRISEALLLKKFSPKLNIQKYLKGQSYLLRVF